MPPDVGNESDRILFVWNGEIQEVPKTIEEFGPLPQNTDEFEEMIENTVRSDVKKQLLRLGWDFLTNKFESIFPPNGEWGVRNLVFLTNTFDLTLRELIQHWNLSWKKLLGVRANDLDPVAFFAHFKKELITARGFTDLVYDLGVEPHILSSMAEKIKNEQFLTVTEKKVHTSVADFDSSLTSGLPARLEKLKL